MRSRRVVLAEELGVGHRPSGRCGNLHTWLQTTVVDRDQHRNRCLGRDQQAYLLGMTADQVQRDQRTETRGEHEGRFVRHLGQQTMSVIAVALDGHRRTGILDGTAGQAARSWVTTV